MSAQPGTTTPGGSFIFGRMFGGLTHRDVVCLSFAIAVHSLLLLWKGGQMLMPDSPQQALGDILIEVRMMDDVPNFDEPGGAAPAPKSFFDRMKSIVRGEGGAPKKEEIAMGKVDKIETPKPTWNKPDVFKEKAFADKKAFDMAKKEDPLNVAMGKTTEIVDKPTQVAFKSAAPALKDNAFKVAPKDAPFQIVKPRNEEALANVNAVPVMVGRTTTAGVKSLDGAPALQAKSFSSANAGKSFAGGGAFGSASKSKEEGGALSTGGATAAASAGVGAGTGFGSGSAANTGRGAGAGAGTGTNVGNGTGRTWGGAGSPSGSRALESLSRNRVSDDGPSSSGLASNKGNGFSITGALANRPILNKVLPAYEQNARVALRFRVDWSGKVLDGIIIEMSSGSPSFDNKVLMALKDWQFSRLPANRTNEIQEGVVTFVFKGV